MWHRSRQGRGRGAGLGVGTRNGGWPGLPLGVPLLQSRRGSGRPALATKLDALKGRRHGGRGGETELAQMGGLGAMLSSPPLPLALSPKPKETSASAPVPVPETASSWPLPLPLARHCHSPRKPPLLAREAPKKALPPRPAGTCKQPISWPGFEKQLSSPSLHRPPDTTPT